MERDEIETAIRALESIRLFRDHYASSGPGAEHIQQVVTMLLTQGARRQMGMYGGLLTNMADAISKAYLNRPAYLPSKEQQEHGEKLLKKQQGG